MKKCPTRDDKTTAGKTDAKRFTSVFHETARGRHDRWMSCLLVFSRVRILMALASQCMDQRRQCIGNERTGRQLILDPREQRSSTVIGRPGRPIRMARDTDARKRDPGSLHSLASPEFRTMFPLRAHTTSAPHGCVGRPRPWPSGSGCRGCTCRSA